MSLPSQLLEFSDVLGRVLLHSVWQILLIALLFELSRMFVKRLFNLNRAQHSVSVYWIGCAAMLLMLLTPIATAICLSLDQQNQSLAAKSTLFPHLVEPMVSESSESRFLQLPNTEVSSKEIEHFHSLSNESGPAENSLFATIRRRLVNLDQFAEASYPWLVMIWLIGVLIFSSRPLIGLLKVRQLRKSILVDSEQVGSEATRLLACLQSKFGIPIELTQSIDVPVVFGMLKPVVLLPFSLLSQLSPIQIELIIRHELAHIRRHDLFINLLQIGAETIFFYHPCVWWVSGVVRCERENCCDDQVALEADQQDYIQALYAVEKSRQPSLALSSQGGDLLARVRRLVGTENLMTESNWLKAFAPLLITLAFVGLIAVPSAVSAGNSTFGSQDTAFQRSYIRKNFSRTKLGKALELELRKLDKVGFTGCVLVAHEGEIILATSEGFADESEGSAIKPNSLFEIASITKSFTATAALILAEQGKLDLESSISDYLPSVPDSSKTIKVKHLLQHRSGIPGDRYGVHHLGLEKAVQTMLGDGPDSEPGANFEYWNQGYILLGEIIANATGKPYTDVIRELIFEPCNMQGSCFNGDQAPDNFVPTIGTGELGEPRSCLDHPYGSYGLSYRGNGGIVTNVFDLWKFHHALQHRQLLKPSSVRASIDTVVENGFHGMGWFVRKMPNGQVQVWHGGRVRGFNCEFRRYPNSDSCIVVLSNKDNAPSTMIAGVLEGILFPADPQTALTESEGKKFVGRYRSNNGRELIIQMKGGKATYRLLWDPSNPNGPVSFGYIQRNEKQDFVLYQSNEINRINVTFNKDKSKVQSVAYRDLDLRFTRVPTKEEVAKDGGNRKPAGLPDKLDEAESRKFIGNYDSATGTSLKIKKIEGHVVFEMLWNKKRQNGRKTLGYVMKYSDKGEYVLYHPRSPLTIEFELNDRGTKVEQISAKALNMDFHRR